MAENTQKSSNGAAAEKPEPPPEENEYEKACGIIRPISAMGEYSKKHWEDVDEILAQAAKKAGFKANLVSNANESEIIQRTIVHNLYYCPIVVCDVSGANPNVMFELGLRLAFGKPTIIVKDKDTKYNFDTASIEHLEYPTSLHYQSILDFGEALCQKIKRTVEKYKKNGKSPFLKAFGDIEAKTLGKEEVSFKEYVDRKFNEIGMSITSLSSTFDNFMAQQRDGNLSRGEELSSLRWRWGEFSREMEIKRRGLLKQIEREEERLKNANSARMVSEIIEKIGQLKNRLARLESL